MKQFYRRKLAMTFAALLLSVLAFAQPASDKKVIFVGQYEGGAIRPEDQVALDSISKWVDVEFWDSGEFNDASADDLYFSESGSMAVGVIISESIGSGQVGNFGLRDGYPVPCILMEYAQLTDDQTHETKWPLLVEGGGIWGYGVPDDVDLQWKIADDMHYITEDYGIGDIISYGATPDRGVPHLHGLSPYHIILANPGRTAGGSDNPDYVQDQAIAMAWMEDPAMLLMNVPYTYLAEGTAEFYDILRKGVIFMFDAFPVGLNKVPAEAFKFSVYPNPAADRAFVRFSAEPGQQVSVNLYSVTGALAGNIFEGIAASGENEVEVQTGGLISGLYLIELQVDNKSAFTKYVIK